jgi:PAS domain S-box-containing protein
VPFRPEDETGGILTAIVGASDDAIISKDLDGVIRSWNRAAERLYGYTAEEVTGRPMSLILPHDRQNELATILDRIKAGEHVEHYETVRQAKDGHLVDVSLTVVPVRNATGSIVGATAIARDLTTRKRTDVALRTSELRWRSIIDSAVDGIVVIDAKGRIEAFNRGAER